MPAIKFRIVAIAIVVMSLATCMYSGFRIPSTADMKDFYSEHQNDFEQHNAALLMKLSKNESIDTGPNPAVGYQWLMVFPHPSIYEEGMEIELRYYTHKKGIGVGSYGTGIAYLDPGTTETYPSIEAMKEDASQVEGFVGYGAIAGNWYYFLWEAD